jgi:hypothetical protein
MRQRLKLPVVTKPWFNAWLGLIGSRSTITGLSFTENTLNVQIIIHNR